MTLRIRLHRALNGNATLGLTLLQQASAAAIVASVALAIAGTEPLVRDLMGSFLHAIELVFVVVFSLEYLLRVWVAGLDPRYTGLRGTARYMATPYALLDLLAIVPFLFGWGAQSLLLRVLRLFRLLALSRLLRYSAAMRLVLQSIFHRRHELMFAIALAGCVILLSAGALYSVEAELQPEVFGSIPRALWWSVTTLTTVGYGDAIPATFLGRCFAALTALAGIGLIAMPTGILAAAFSEAFRVNRETQAVLLVATDRAVDQ